LPESDEQPKSPDEISLTPPPSKEKPDAPQGGKGDGPAATAAKPEGKAKKAAPPPVEEPVFPTAIYAIKTSIGHEKTVADGIAFKAKREKVEVYSILSPAPMRGYVYLEGVNPDRLTDLVKGVKRARGMVRARGTTDAGASAIPIDQIAHFLEPKPLVSGIVEGNIVEITQGPFKGEKARVIQIDENKEEITVELIEAMISIPITVRGDAVRVLEKEDDREGESAEA
jgi:transcriptional antiterminator NusG